MRTSIFLFALLVPSAASAQLHWDGSIGAGAYKRFLSSKPAGDAMFGPAIDLRAHIALLPFIRAGLYGSWDWSPVDGSPAPPRNLFAFGGEGRVFSPWPNGNLRLYLSLGFGYVAVVGPGGYKVPITPKGQMTFLSNVEGSGGGYAEVPVGIGAIYKLRGPLFLFAELRNRFGFGFWGTLYGEGGGRPAREPTLGSQRIAADGYDVYGLGLVLGVGLDK